MAELIPAPRRRQNDLLLRLLSQPTNQQQITHPVQGVSNLANDLVRVMALQRGAQGDQQTIAGRRAVLENLLSQQSGGRSIGPGVTPGGIPFQGRSEPGAQLISPDRQNILRSLGANDETLPGAVDLATELLMKNTAPPEAGKPFTLSPGQTRFSADNREVASGGPSLPSGREKQVDNLMARGFSLTDAQDIAAGRIKVNQDQIFGDTVLTNTATGESRVVTPGGQRTSQASRIPVKTQGELSAKNAEIDRVLGLMNPELEQAAEQGIGPMSNLFAAVDAVVGGFVSGDEPLFPDTAASRQQLRQFKQIAKAALVNNPKFPIAEQKIVDQLLPDPDTFFENPAVGLQNIGTLRDFLKTIRAGNEASISGRPAPGSPARPTTREDFDALPSGSQFIHPRTGEIRIKN